MGWWSIPGSNDEVTGDEPADAAVGMLAPIRERTPLPTLDELLDAIEGVLASASDVIAEPLGARHVAVGPMPRHVGTPDPDLVAMLRPGVVAISEPYLESFERRPTIREVLEAISFVLCSRPTRYVRDLGASKLDYDLEVSGL